MSEGPSGQPDGGSSPILGAQPRKNRRSIQLDQSDEEDVQMQALQGSRRLDSVLADQEKQTGEPMDVDWEEKERVPGSMTHNNKRRGASTINRTNVDDHIYRLPDSADETDELLMPPPTSTRPRRIVSNKKQAKATRAKNLLVNAQKKSAPEQPTAAETSSKPESVVPIPGATPRAPEDAGKTARSTRGSQKPPTLPRSPSVQIVGQQSLPVKPTELTEDPIETDNDDRSVVPMAKGKDGKTRPEAAAEPRGLARQLRPRKTALQGATAAVAEKDVNTEAKEDDNDREAIEAAKRQLIENSERDKKAWEEKVAAQTRPRDIFTPTVVAQAAHTESTLQESTTPATNGRFGPPHKFRDRTAKQDRSISNAELRASTARSLKRNVSFVDQVPHGTEIRDVQTEAKDAIPPRDQKPTNEGKDVIPLSGQNPTAKAKDVVSPSGQKSTIETEAVEEKEAPRAAKSEELVDLKLRSTKEQAAKEKKSEELVDPKFGLTQEQTAKEKKPSGEQRTVKVTPVYPPGMDAGDFLEPAGQPHNEVAHSLAKPGKKAPAKARQTSKNKPASQSTSQTNGKISARKSAAAAKPPAAARKAMKSKEIVISSDDDSSISSYYSSGAEKPISKAEQVTRNKLVSTGPTGLDLAEQPNAPVNEPAADIPTQLVQKPVPVVDGKRSPEPESQGSPPPQQDQPAPLTARSPSRSPARLLSQTPSVGALGEKVVGDKDPSTSHVQGTTNDEIVEHDGDKDGDDRTDNPPNANTTKPPKESTPAITHTSSSETEDSTDDDSDASMESTPSPDNQHALDKILQLKARQSMEPSSSQRLKENASQRRPTKPARRGSGSTRATNDDDAPTSAQRPTGHEIVSVTEVRASRQPASSQPAMTQEPPSLSTAARATRGRNAAPPPSSIRTFGSQLTLEMQENHQWQSVSARQTEVRREPATGIPGFKRRIPGIRPFSDDDDDESSSSSSSSLTSSSNSSSSADEDE